MDTYTVSPPQPHRPARLTPGSVTLAWVIRTAVGSPLVPEVKISMNRSSAAAGTGSGSARAGSSISPSAITGTGMAGSSAA